MTYRQFKIIMNYRPAYDSAIGTGVDNSIDPVITKDPNQYLADRVDRISITDLLIITVLILVSVFLAIQIGKSANFSNN